MVPAVQSDRWLYAWALGHAAVGAASLLFPLYAIALGGGAFIVGLLAATAAFAGVPGALLWGRLARRPEVRRWLVLFALVATAVVMAVVPAIRDQWPLVVANAVLWFAVAAAAPVLNLLVVDGAPEREWERRIARLQTFQGYGWVAGLLAGAAWTSVAEVVLDPVIARQSFFWLCAGGGAVASILGARWLPRHPTLEEERFLRVYRTFRRPRLGAGRYLKFVPYVPGRAYWGIRSFDARRAADRFSSALGAYLLAATLFSVGSAAFWAPMPAYLTGLGYTDGQVFALFVASSLGAALFYTRAGEWAVTGDLRTLQSRALGARAMLFPLVAVVGTVATTFDYHLVVIATLFVLVGVSWAVIAVTATGLVARLSPAEVRGDALGAYAALAGLGGGVGSFAGGWLAGRAGYVVSFVAAGGLVLLGASLVQATRGRTDASRTETA